MLPRSNISASTTTLSIKSTNHKRANKTSEADEATTVNHGRITTDTTAVGAAAVVIGAEEVAVVVVVAAAVVAGEEDGAVGNKQQRK